MDPGKKKRGAEDKSLGREAGWDSSANPSQVQKTTTTLMHIWGIQPTLERDLWIVEATGWLVGS